MARPPFSEGVGPGQVGAGDPAAELLIFPAPGEPDTIVIRNCFLNVIPPGTRGQLFVTTFPDPTVNPFILMHVDASTFLEDASLEMRFVMPTGAHLWLSCDGVSGGIARGAVMFYRLTPT